MKKDVQNAKQQHLKILNNILNEGGKGIKGIKIFKSALLFGEKLSTIAILSAEKKLKDKIKTLKQGDHLDIDVPITVKVILFYDEETKTTRARPKVCCRCVCVKDDVGWGCFCKGSCC